MIAPGTLLCLYAGALTLWPERRPGPADRGVLAYVERGERCLCLAAIQHGTSETYDIFVLAASGMLGWTTQTSYNILVVQSWGHAQP